MSLWGSACTLCATECGQWCSVVVVRRSGAGNGCHYHFNGFSWNNKEFLVLESLMHWCLALAAVGSSAPSGPEEEKGGGLTCLRVIGREATSLVYIVMGGSREAPRE